MARLGHSSVALPDNSIVLMGGYYWTTSTNYKNDVWRSTDYGATWTLVNASAGWTGRLDHSSVVMPDGSIVLMGGFGASLKNDTWRSTDNGATWTQMNASSGWTVRERHTSVALPDGSIVLMGGDTTGGRRNDVWRSTNFGVTWTQVNASAGWAARESHTSVALPDSSIVLMGGMTGTAYKNDTWRFNPVGSSLQNPSHIYTSPGLYQVALQASNTGGYNNTRKAGYLNVTVLSAPVSAFTTNTTSGTAPLAVQFTDTSTNSPVAWIWNATNVTGNNTPFTFSTSQSPAYVFGIGNFSISLNATNAGGSNTSTQLTFIRVSTPAVPAPVANFTANVTTGTSPLSVLFTDLSKNIPTGWGWYFGDEKYTQPWTQVNASAGWAARDGHTSVVLKEGSIILMGGEGNGGAKYNDVWSSADNGVMWTQVSAGAAWSARFYHSSVLMPDESIILTGGLTGGGGTNDVWKSNTSGATWVQINASAEWSARWYHASVGMPDGSLVLMGGLDGAHKNDTWRSTDNGATWGLVNASSGWAARSGHSSLILPDTSIILMGGFDSTNLYNDVWRSTDHGATWSRVNASAGWSGRENPGSVVMPDGSLLLSGGYSNANKNDVWRSTDYGVTWSRVNGSAGWSGRYGHTVLVMPDSSVVLAGGRDNSAVKTNDVWRFVSTGSSGVNPTHTYHESGIYQVALQAYNTGGYNSTRKTGFITVTAPPVPVATFTTNTSSGTAPLAVQFTDTSSNAPTAWSWNATNVTGNNTPFSFSASQNPAHLFGVGNFSIKLNTTNSAGSNTSTQFTFVNVSAPAVPAPVANFTANVTSGVAPLAVQFTDTSTGTPTAWTWSFGDGNSSTLQNPVYTYTTAGYYDVNLTVTTTSGVNTTSRTGCIQVSRRATPFVPNSSTSSAYEFIVNKTGNEINYTYSGSNILLSNITGFTQIVVGTYGVDLGGGNISGNVSSVIFSLEPVITNLEGQQVTVVANVTKAKWNNTCNFTIGVALTTTTQDTDYKTHLPEGATDYTPFAVLNITTSGEGATGAILNISIPYTWYANYTDTPDNTQGKNFTYVMWTHGSPVTTTPLTPDWGPDDPPKKWFTVKTPGLSPFGMIGATAKSSSPPGPSPGPSGGGGGGGGSGTYTGKIIQFGVPAKPGLTEAAVMKNTSVTGTGITESGPVIADLSGLEGIRAAWAVEIVRQPDANATITTSIIQEPGSAVQDAFRTALRSAQLDIAQIAYVMQVTKSGMSSTGPATVSMSIPQNWINNYGGMGVIRIIRLGDDGTPEVLTTRFSNYDRDTGYLNFEAPSPKGLSVFGLVAVRTYVPVTGTPAVTPPVAPAVTSIPAQTPQVYPPTGALPPATLIGAGIVVLVLAGIGIYVYTRKQK
jgi:PKD repeat protein